MEFSHDFGLKAFNAIIFIIVGNVKNLNVQHGLKIANRRNKAY